MNITKNTMNSKQLLLLFKLILPAFCVGLLLFVCLFSGKITVNYFDISADSSGNVYIGELTQIRVVDSSGNTIRKIKTQTLNGYRFTIRDDILYWSTGSNIRAKDLEGNELDLKYDNNVPSESFIDQEQFIAYDGTKYYFKNDIWGKNAYLLHNGEEKMVYHMPTFDCIMRLSIPLLGTYIMLVVIIMTFSVMKKEERKKNK
ncbi:MAG: hypothetical protein IJI50_06610 [Ruminococcus sp.]|nr:hypothetical protein [Ruminococcus sp.]